MTYGLRFVVIALAAFGVASLVVSLGVWWWVRRPDYGRERSAAAVFQTRLAPAVMSLIALLLAITSFILFEPRGGEERTGVLLPVCAALAAAMIGTTIFRLARMVRASRRALAHWMRSAEQVTLPGVTVPAYRIECAFPIVALAGLFRPRLLVAGSVLDACPPDEMQVILAHEEWHLRNGDNLRRLLVAIAPDVMMWTPLARRLSALWHSAAEDAADAEAAVTHPAARVALAEALIRIGRMAPAGSTPTVLPASAFFRGENLERRIRRLLDPAANFGSHRRRSSWLIAAAGSILIVSLFALHPIHELVEAAVTLLP